MPIFAIEDRAKIPSQDSEACDFLNRQRLGREAGGRAPHPGTWRGRLFDNCRAKLDNGKARVGKKVAAVSYNSQRRPGFYNEATRAGDKLLQKSACIRLDGPTSYITRQPENLALLGFYKEAARV